MDEVGFQILKAFPHRKLKRKEKQETSMALKLQRAKELPAFDRQVVFAEVDKSNVRFEDYTKEQRMVFAAEARAQKLGVIQSHEARRARY